METSQLALWRSEFGRSYTDRNDREKPERVESWRRILEGVAVNRVLEVGCNVGWNLEYLRRLSIPELYGIEPQPYAVERARWRGPAFGVLQGTAFDLPFNFDWRDRVAVLAFFERWLREHGEGSDGRFFAEPPRMGLAPEPDPVTGKLVPEMRGMIWLKPFDLGVSQEARITTPFDPETEQFKARLELERRTGTSESWLRLNHSFVAALRRRLGPGPVA